MSARVGSAAIYVVAGRAERRVHCQVEAALVFTRIGHSHMVTYHLIEEKRKGERLEIGSGTPVDKASALTLLESIRDVDEPSDGWIPTSVLFKSDRAIAWHVPAAVRGIYYKRGKSHAMRVPLPAFVFIARREGELQVFAVDGDERPGPKTRLYHAPLANVHASGLLCWGSADRPHFGLSEIPDYEAAVFKTWFTHPNHARAIAGNHAWALDKKDDDYIFDFYRRMSGKKAKRFPSSALVKTKLTLGKVCA